MPPDPFPGPDARKGREAPSSMTSNVLCSDCLVKWLARSDDERTCWMCGVEVPVPTWTSPCIKDDGTWQEEYLQAWAAMFGYAPLDTAHDLA